MNQQSNFHYQSDNYDRASQRFVIPLYIKDDLGNYEFSSTGTLVKYNNHHYIIFAAHALLDESTINRLFTFSIDGTFLPILENSIGYKIFKESDIAIVDCFGAQFMQKNYFNLNITDFTGFDKKHFAWTGFPASKASAKKIHNSKSTDDLREKYVTSQDENLYFTNAKYYTIISKLNSFHKLEITGKYDRKKVSLKYAGPVSMGIHPAGMSGGAMYFFAKKQELKDDIDSTFRFAGIGIGYKKDNTIVGVPQPKIISLLENLNSEHPLTITIDTITTTPPQEIEK